MMTLILVVAVLVAFFAFLVKDDKSFSLFLMMMSLGVMFIAGGIFGKGRPIVGLSNGDVRELVCSTPLPTIGGEYIGVLLKEPNGDVEFRALKTPSLPKTFVVRDGKYVPYPDGK